MARRKRRSRLRGVVAILAILLLIGSVIATFALLYLKSQSDDETFKTAKPVVTDIVRKAVATGSIVPRHEVQIKPRVSGIVHKLFVKPGDLLEEGALIAEIKIVPDMAALARAESSIRSAQIAAKHAAAELRRAERLADKGLLSRRELSEAKLQHSLRKAELAAAAKQLRVVRDGAVRRTDKTANTSVRSTVAGTVLEAPVKEGESVIESNTFNAGTTIATVADMSDLVFLGRVDEADVDKIRVGMAVNIRIGAIDDFRFTGKLEYIAPKGQQLEGAIQFEIRAALQPDDKVVIRAGYSANAEIVLERREQVLALSESLLQFDGDMTYVEVEVAPGKFERRDLQLGISDGINIEVKGGVELDTVIKQPEPTEPDKAKRR